MKHILTISFLAALAAPSILSQSQPQETKSPKEVVEEFWKFEAEGGGLTPDGWREAATFFVRPGPPQQRKIIGVIFKKYSVDQAWVKGDRAEIHVGYDDAGEIDNSLRFSLPQQDPRFEYKTTVVHHLVRTDRQWEIGPDGVTEKEVSGPLAWRIEGPTGDPFVTVDTAIRYVRDRRNKTTDPNIRKNAEATLAKLLKFR